MTFHLSWTLALANVGFQLSVFTKVFQVNYRALRGGQTGSLALQMRRAEPMPSKREAFKEGLRKPGC